MGGTKLDVYWPFIIKAIKDRVNSNNTAGVRSVISALVENKTIPQNLSENISEEEILTIGAKTIETDEYLLVSAKDDVFINRNPSYSLNKVVKVSSIIQAAAIILTTLFAAASVIVSYWDYKKDDEAKIFLLPQVERKDTLTLKPDIPSKLTIGILIDTGSKKTVDSVP